MKSWRWLALLLLAPPIAHPQASTATVSGTVRDQTNAVIAGAGLTLTSAGTNAKIQTSSNDVGSYVFPGIIPGVYKLEAESPGMARYEVTLVVEVQQKVTIDPVLKPGATTTTVEIQDVTPMVNLTDAIGSHVISHAEIDQLPRSGRQISSLQVLVPGMSGTYQADGLRYGSTDWSLDGSPLTSRTRGTVENRQPGLDSIQEVSVDTNNVSAKYNSPVAITLSTKSGANQIHGSVFETQVNSAVGGARSRIQSNAAPPYHNRAEFGASAGAPVYLPRLYNGRNRTFWFFSYEARRELSNAYVGYSVPTVAMRNGDFSGLVNSNGMQSRIYDPWTTVAGAAPNLYPRDQFNYGGKLNAIDPSRASPLWTYLMRITPLATLANVNPLISSNWYGNQSTVWRDWTTATRIDHHFSAHDLFYARYSKNNMTNDTPFSGAVPLLTNDANRNAYVSPAQSLATSWVHIVSPTLYNELLVSVYRQAFYQSSNPSSPKDYAAILGLPNPFGGLQWPDILTIGLNGSLWRTVYPNADHSTFYEINDNVTRIVGKHQLMAGVHLRRDLVNYLPQQQEAAGLLSPVANWTALWNPAGSINSPSPTPFTGSTIASAFLGMDQYAAQTVHKYFYERQNQYALYFQDNYKITRRLALNLGVRWEAWPAMTEKYNNLAGFDSVRNALVLTQPLQAYEQLVTGLSANVAIMQQMGVKFIDYKQAGLPRSLQYGNWKDFSPRVGFAYRVTGGNRPLVLRSGFSMAYYPLQIYDSLNQIKAGVPFLSTPLYYPDSAGYYPDGLPGYSLRSVPTYVAGLNTRHVLDNAGVSGLTPGNLGVAYLAPHMPDSRVADGNITLEKEVLPKTLLRLSWVANHNANIDVYENLNPQTPSFVWATQTHTPYPTSAGATRPYSSILGNVLEMGRWGYSNYSSVRAELKRRFANGLSFDVFYVANNAYALGNTNNQGTSLTLYPASYYLQSQVAGLTQDQLNRTINYARNTTFPHRQITWNWVAAVPVGKGKRFLGNSPTWLDAVAGGWQISGYGNWGTSWWSLPASQFPTGARLQINGSKYHVEDCRSGTCYSAYLYYNGWINPAQINSRDAKTGQPNGIMGVPAGYQPFAQPLNVDPSSPYFGTNTVSIPLSNGTNYIGTWGGISPLNNQIFESRGLWILHASLFKEFPVRERMKLRFQWDVFNPTNSPEEPQIPNANGLIYTYTNGQAARNMQFTLRLLW